jgi:hypothetical protein
MIGYLPFAISHISESNRVYNGRPSDQVCRMGLNDILQICLASASTTGEASLAQNLRIIGEQLIGIGSMSSTSFRSFLLDASIRSRFGYLEALQNLVSLGKFDDNKYLDELKAVSSDVLPSVFDAETIVPIDLGPTVGSEESLLRSQSYVSMYGQLMLHWEDICAVSRQIEMDLLC